MNTYSISTRWIIESFVISLHEYFMRNFIGDFWLNFVTVLDERIIKVYAIKKKRNFDDESWNDVTTRLQKNNNLKLI